MPLIAETKRTEFELVPQGSHVARVYGITYLGTLPGEYMGEYKETPTIRISFELPNETRTFGEEEKPMVISQEYTFSMHEKANLRKAVHGIIGAQLKEHEAAAFDVYDIMGRTCLISVIHKTPKKGGNDYAAVESVMPLPKGMEAPKPFNPEFRFDLTDHWSEEAFSKLPHFLQEKIKTSIDYRKKYGTYTEKPEEEEIKPEDVAF